MLLKKQVLSCINNCMIPFSLLFINKPPLLNNFTIMDDNGFLKISGLQKNLNIYIVSAQKD